MSEIVKGLFQEMSLRNISMLSMLNGLKYNQKEIRPFLAFLGGEVVSLDHLRSRNRIAGNEVPGFWGEAVGESRLNEVS